MARSVEPRGDLVAVIVLFALQLLVSIALIGLSAVAGMVSDSCGDGHCDFALMTFSGFLIIIGALVIFVAALFVASSLRRRGRFSWWVPLAGTGAVIVLFVISSGLLAASVSGSA